MRQIQSIVSILVIVLVSSVNTIGAQVPDYELPATPENVVWGWYPIDRAPVLTIASGETVRIDTLTHAGSTQAADPERHLGQLGIAPNEVLQDVIDFWNSKDARPREGRGPHLITGPISVSYTHLTLPTKA